MALFGSVAKGTNNDKSDVDLLIDKGDIFGFGFGGFCMDVEEALGVRVDILTYPKKDLYTLILKSFSHELLLDEEMLKND